MTDPVPPPEEVTASAGPVPRESEQRARIIVENALDYAIFTLDRDGRIIDWLPGAQQVYGWTADEIVGRHVGLTFTPEDQAKGEADLELETARRDGAAPNVRWHLHKDGSRIFIDGVNRAIYDEAGEVRGFLKIGQDVTGRHAAQDALNESEERFRGFAEASNDVLWIADAETGRLEYVSPAYEKVWGEPRDAVMSDVTHWARRLHPEDAIKAGEGIERLRQGERYNAEYRIVRPDGAVRFIHDAGFPILKDGKVFRLAGVAQDLTERRLAERALVESEMRLRSLVEGLPQLVWRAQGQGHWTWASPQWTAFTGQADADSRDLGWLEAVHPDDRAAVLKAWAQPERSGGFQVEYRIRRGSDGQYIWFQTLATPVRDPTGMLVEWLGTSTDIDDLRRLQRHQQTLLGELQHRVRNTLGVVRSIARRSAETAEDKEELASHLQGRLAAFSRVQSAVTRTPQGGVDLASIVEDELLAHAARESEALTVKGPEIWLRPRPAESLSLAIHELATNAVKYGALSRQGGRLSIHWAVEDQESEPRLRLVWAEAGVILPPDGPSRRGFGMDLLERTLPYELDAQTAAEFRPTGFRFTMTLPLANLVMD